MLEEEEKKQNLNSEEGKEEHIDDIMKTEDFFDDAMNEGVPSVRFGNFTAQGSHLRGTMRQLIKPPQFSKP